MNHSPVIITGGSGYIGSHVVQLLAKKGFDPIIFDRTPPHDSAHARYERGDVRIYENLRRVFVRYHPAGIIHLAAQTSVTEAERQPRECADVNVRGTRNVIAAMKESGCLSVVFSSSAAVYGNTRGKIIESAPIKPLGVYGKTKAEAERELMNQKETGMITAVVLRLFNVAGAVRGVPAIPNYKRQHTLISNAFRVAYGHKKKLTLYGAHFPTLDGSAARDYVHVLDVAGAILAAFAYIQNEGHNVVANVGSGVGTTNLEVIHMIEEMTRRHIPIILAPQERHNIVSSVAGGSVARRILGWSPVRSDIGRIIQSYI